MQKININDDFDIIIRNPIKTLLFLEKKEKRNHLIGLFTFTLIVLVYILVLSNSPLSTLIALTVYFIIMNLFNKFAYPLLSNSFDKLESFEFLLTLEDRPVLETIFNVDDKNIKFVYDKENVVMRRFIDIDEVERRTDIERDTLYAESDGTFILALKWQDNKKGE